MKAFCLKCEKELFNEEKCLCEGEDYNIIFGDIQMTDDGFICECGNRAVRRTMHINCNPIYKVSYLCDKCKNVICTETHYESHC